MSDATSSDEWSPWAQAALFFALAFLGIQGASAVLQGTITWPALVSAMIAALTGAGIVYSYEWRRQAGVLKANASADSSEGNAPEDQNTSTDTAERLTSETDPHDETTSSASEGSST